MIVPDFGRIAAVLMAAAVATVGAGYLVLAPPSQAAGPRCTIFFTFQGESMMPTIHNAQRIAIDRCAFGTRLPRRGEIVAFKAVPAGQPDRLFVKRIIALPGDVVAIRSQRVYINGRALAEPYVKTPAMYWFPARRVPPKSYFVLGDNRNNSDDSHLWLWLPARDIVGAVKRP